MNTAHRRFGFTLLEVMLALMVFSIAVVALVAAINGVGNASTESRVFREVESRLESLLTEVTRMPKDPSASPTERTWEKTVKENGVEYHLKKTPVEITNTEGQVLPEMFTIKATARWKEGGQEEELVAETIVYPPLYAPVP
jgi:prepilin-type N-terminal cleavage/methylation domain-containing protein